MHIRPILSAMWRNRTGSVLVAIQIALTLAIVVNSMFMVKNRTEFIGRPSGMDVENIVIATSIGFGMAYNHDDTIENDLRVLRELPGVVAATSANHVPLSGSGNGSGFRASMEEDAPRASGNVFMFDEQGVDTLGVTVSEGRGFNATEILRSDNENYERMPPQVLITEAYGKVLYPDQSALGQRLYNNLGDSSEIIGIIKHMHGSWVNWDNLDNVLWVPARSKGPTTRYIIRAVPGQRDSLIPLIEKTLTDLNRNRLVRKVGSMSDSVARTYEADNAIATVLSLAIILLLIITGLGIVGLASFSVRQRTKQIGTRRAIGARKRDIIVYFLTENWLMTTIGIIIGTVLTIALNYSLSSMFDMERLNYVYLPIGMALLWLIGFIAVAGPSRRASMISPAIATRNV